MRGRGLQLFIFFLFLCFSYAKATHNRAGEITYKRIAPFTAVRGGITVEVYTYSITVIKYTDDGQGIADRCVDTVYFGDGEIGIAPRVNGGSSSCMCGSMNGNAVTCGSLIINEPGPNNGYKVKQNIYTIIHTYPSAGTYLIRSLDPNRNAGVRNILNSVTQYFYVESLLIINNLTGANSSPVFAFAPIDRACMGVCFEHNPGAYDPDGDSLSYEITTSRGKGGQTVPGYFYPETGPGGTYGIDARTGLLRWCTPQVTDEYNIAFIVKEWRKNTSGNYQMIGYVLRDMQVIVKSPCAMPPSIQVQDFCVEAGKTVTANLVVKDMNHGDIVTVRGGGGAFSGAPPYPTYSPSSGLIDSLKNYSFNVFFNWNTTCDHIRLLPYLTTFKVEDNGSVHPTKLVSFSTFSVKVVPPAVQEVTAVPAGSNMQITWKPTGCNPSTNPLVGYKIYRKEDCTPFIPTPCETGIPAASGFTLVGETGTNTASFLDTNGGDGLVVGQDYSYVVVALYRDGSQALGSSQVCARLKRDVPVLLNVDVKSTAAATGQVWIRWTRPLTDAGNLDTTAFPGPYKFILKHRAGFNDAFALVQEFNASRVPGLDTQYTHVNINTELMHQEYIIEFMSGSTLIGSSQKASSIFLTTTPSDRRIDLQWTFKTPWENQSYTVMRQDSTSPNFVLLGTTTASVFTDTSNVVNGSSYCYYVISQGQYSDPTVFKPLMNASQISCSKAVDKTPPAAPTITIDADCPLGTVEVRWSDVKDIPGSDDVAKYVLYYKPLVNGVYQEIATVMRNEQLLFQQDDPNSFSGCYAVKAVDIHDNESPLSQDFCIDNCPEFELPNIFSPNKDEVNDFYHAIKVRQIKEINLSIVDRWGNLVYSTKDPYFKWDGISTLSKTAVAEGTFYYVCDVFEPRLKGIVKRTLKGYLEVVR